ncbi:RnfABCDGE type electron transport complex subunit B [bacterium]|jgi:Na+-translocating ferredoxin:NAD+ oxidoreductase RNF subunit RnfB|nr:RnfABCDGE type electron transport complex subunit B [bacterium]
MSIEVIIYSTGALLLLGIGFGIALSLSSKLLRVEEDPRIKNISDILPNINCGACGFAGCFSYAEAIVTKKEKINLCMPGGEKTSKKIADLMGMAPDSIEKKVAVIHCCGGGIGRKKYDYSGVKDCRIINMVAGGSVECGYGCLMGYACLKSCPVHAIKKNENQMPYVIRDKCIGCGRCVNTCPRNLIELVEDAKKVHILCSSHDRGADVIKVCSVGCIGCGKCVQACPFNAIRMENNLAVIDYSKCKVCGKCVEVCPVKVIYDWRKNFIMPGKQRKSEKTNEL